MIDISKLDKAAVLVALYKYAKVQGWGILHARKEDMTLEEANNLLEINMYFDYLHGRVMKVDLSKDILHTYLYDRDNGEGEALNALKLEHLI